ncbi:chromosome-partitioning ATPase Soj [mine drainage metagenome]|uniref:Chromosome-partitioning ATPase Soj n=1 Tax=mine drainage metagenome TaxID=410659 RepID=A0A1J5QPL6_9ZZZZ
MVYTLAVANQKGGVAKTTSAANVADAAASRGLRVLLVDLDPQGNATALTDAQAKTTDANPFGKQQTLTVADALYYAQEKVSAAEQPGTILSVLVSAGEHWPASLHVAPANEDLASRGDETFRGSERRLAIALSGTAEHYDLVVLDCPPSLGPLFVNALHAADGVLLVTEPADNSLEGLPRSAESLYRVQGRRAQQPLRPELLGVVATNVPGREARAAELLAGIRDSYGELLWDVVPRRSVVRQAEGAHAPLRAFGAQGRDVVEVYARITTRLLEHAGLTTREV